MMPKTLFTAAFVALIAGSLSACAQTTPASYKPHLSVLAKELPPSEAPIDMFALQGTWKGTATLLRDVNPPGTKPDCSQTLRVTWIVNGSELVGESFNRKNIKIGYDGNIDSKGRLAAVAVTPNGAKESVIGWFMNGRAIAFVRGGNSKDYCDFRFDLTKAE
ncbi:hypothetical protein HBA54_20535 [Pelagibius litoralis]|uniref:DUF1579 domain-containing protein n=1 Tax=Pelagibius litoralis TaxID=374515 RepID=A0A967F0R1_9PROT|nr:hypothetical protein [Pelagibius litoralis]NIA70991.1 hypothetical protein [Pelagibius litoralis]